MQIRAFIVRLEKYWMMWNVCTKSACLEEARIAYKHICIYWKTYFRLMKIDTYSRETTLLNLIMFPSEKGSTLKGKHLRPVGIFWKEIPFHLYAFFRVDPFIEGSLNNWRKAIKVFTLENMRKNLRVYQLGASVLFSYPFSLFSCRKILIGQCFVSRDQWTFERLSSQYGMT